jgi:hypothetical protein
VAGDESDTMLLLAILDTLISTFGPFLIPAALFVVGAIGYLLLYLVTRGRRETYTDDLS